MNKLKKYLKIYFIFLKNCLSREMEFRWHFFLHNFVSLSWAAVTMLSFFFIFSHTNVVQGWTLEQMMLLSATYYLFDRIFDGFFDINFQLFSQIVNSGDLDLILTKPISSQFCISLRKVSFNGIFNNMLMLAIIFYLVRKYFWPVPIINILSYFLLLLIGMIIIYSLWFSSLLLVFKLGRVGNINHLFRPIYQICKIPVDVVGPVLKPLFTYVLPLAFVATIPVKSLIGTPIPLLIIYGMMAAIILFYLSHRLWLSALKHYSSASS